MTSPSATFEERRLEILRHTTGYPKNYRNHFVTEERCENFDVLERMVKEGLMTKSVRSWCPGLIYQATEKGKALLEEQPS